MEVLRSLLFVPADKMKMLDKIDILNSDAFILDLEDSVSDNNKEIARENIKSKLSRLNDTGKHIFIRINGLGSKYIYEDINNTINLNIEGYMIPKFESLTQTKEVFEFLSEREKEYKITPKIKIILMVENPKGILELNNLSILFDRVIALALGAEDYIYSLSVFGDISEDMVDLARRKIILHSKARDILAIDTVYRDYKNIQGLKKELQKIVTMGFNSKLAIHPSQIEVINSAFTPTKEEIMRMKIILKYSESIEKDGAISIDGVMYDPPHLKWAIKLKKYLDNIDTNRNGKD